MIDLLINVSCVCGIIFVCFLLLYLLALGFMGLYESWLDNKRRKFDYFEFERWKKEKRGVNDNE